MLDIDGTLVDTNHHHTIAWFRAFRQHGIVLPVWRIHRHIGMGGDQLVRALTDERVEREQGDDIRTAEGVLYAEVMGEVPTMEGSRELIEELKRRGHTLVLASSAKAQEVEHYLDLLDARELADGWTTSADVQATKPAPDLVQAALERAGERDGDAVDGRRHPLGCQGSPRCRGADACRADRRLRRAGAHRRWRARRVRVGLGAVCRA